MTELDLDGCQGYYGIKYHMEDACLENNRDINNASVSPPFAIFSKKYYNDINNLDHAKKHDYCFIGNISSCIERRTWVIEFAKKYFTDRSVFINTDINNTIPSLGIFDLSHTNIGYSPRTHSDNQSRDAQYRNISENVFYFQTMCQSKFVLCPAGDAPWSFRFYETLMCKSIPVVDTWHHTYRTKEEADIHYKYILANSDTSTITDNVYESLISENTKLFEMYHMYN